MRNKSVVIALAIIISALCLYYLSLTLVARKVQQQATEYATDVNGTIDLARKQNYLDSLWDKRAYNLFGTEFSYREVKENELSLGLDLQGGMHVVLEVSPADVILGLAANKQDQKVIAALRSARRMQTSSQSEFADLLYDAFKREHPGENLAPCFTRRGLVNFSYTNLQPK